MPPIPRRAPRPAAQPGSCPVTRRQALMLDQLSDPACSPGFADFWLLAEAVQVRPGVDLRRLERAAQRVSARHDTLRLRFFRDRRGWRARIAEAPQGGVEEITLPPEDLAGDARFHEAVRAIARRPLDPLAGPLAEILLLRCGARGDVLVTRVHHAAADGTGMVVLTEDLLMLLMGLPIVGRAMSHLEYLRDWELPKGAARRENEAYWQAVLQDFPPAPQVGRKAKGLEPLWRGVGWTGTRNLAVHATPASRAALPETAAEIGVTPDALYYTAFAQALCGVYGLDRVGVTVPVARAEPALAAYCGDRITCVPVIHEARPMPEGLPEAARATRQALLSALAHLPAEALQPGSEAEARAIARGCHLQQFHSTTPMARERARRSMFSQGFARQQGETRRVGGLQITKLPLPGTRITNELGIDIGRGDGAAAFTLCCDEDAYTPAEVERLAREVCALAGLVPERLSLG
jgi:hypothetical protein